MNKNIIILLLIIVLIILGGFTYYQYQQSQKRTENLSNNQNIPVDYSKEITGRFILQDSTQAGFDFIGNGKVIWQNELNTPADELSIFWLDDKTFVTKDIQRIDQTSPPRINIYVVNKFDGKNLELKKLWTGWGDYNFDTLNFVKSGM